MSEPSEEELIRRAEELEKESEKAPPLAVDHKLKALADEVLGLLEHQREDPVAQRKSLVRLAKARPISNLLKQSGLIAIKEDETLGRVVIALRADDELVDRMHRANSAEILHSKDAPLLRVFRGDSENLPT